MKKASILSFQFADNYGAVLQIYALSTILKKYDLDVEIIDYQPKELTKMYEVGINLKENLRKRGLVGTSKDIVAKLLQAKNNIPRRKNFQDFRNSHLNLTQKTYLLDSELIDDKELKKYDYYFVGSDQVWNPKLINSTGDAYFLNYSNEKSRKISYAASIAEPINSEDEDLFLRNLNRFDNISVREESAREMLNDFIDRDIEVTLDPTLLLTKEEWIEIVPKKNSNQKSFILVYDLVKDARIIEIANKISEELNLEIISFSGKEGYNNWRSSFMGFNPVDLLDLFDKAAFVVTSSFHGTAFSVIFEKEFYTVPHPTRGSRMIDFLTSIDLEDRLIEVTENISLDKKIDYTVPNKKKNELRDKSIHFIEKGLGL